METTIIIIGIIIIGIMEIWNYTRIREHRSENNNDYFRIAKRLNRMDSCLGLYWQPIHERYTDEGGKYITKKDFSALLDYLQIKSVTVPEKPETIKFIKKR